VARAITRREAGKLDMRHRVYRRMYDHFDSLPAPCRQALKETQSWSVAEMIRCGAAHCHHQETSHAV
jgi:hypothetical protein